MTDPAALIRYEHNELRGEGRFVYLVDGVETVQVTQEPSNAKHVGWNREKVLASRPREEMIYDALFGYAARAFS